MRRRVRNATINALVAVASLSVVMLVAEVSLRFLPVIDPIIWQPVSEASPVLRHRPDRDILWSRDWDFAMANRRHVNNDGFVNDQDYSPEGPQPLLAVVGDSYVEALMNPYPATFYARLAEAVGEAGRIYSFGVSGGPLSEYLVWADYARERYRPDAMVVVVVGNDFDQSFYRFKPVRGLHYFAADATVADPKLERVDREDGWLRRALLSSAVVRYAFFHLQAGESLRQIRIAWENLWAEDTASYQGNVDADASPERVSEGRRAADMFVTALPARAGLPPSRILLVIDALRPGIYEPDGGEAAQASYWGLMRRHLMDAAREAGLQVLDLDPIFLAGHRATGERFEFETDGHWNDRAHGLVAETIRGSEFFRSVFPGLSPVKP